MGMYTAVWLDATLTKRGFEIVSCFYNSRFALDAFDHQNSSTWGQVAVLYPEMASWGKFERCDFVPLCENDMDFDPCWDGDITVAAEADNKLGWAPHPGRLSTDDRRWVFTAQVKNIGGVVEYFLSQVLPFLVEKVNRGWVRYEEMAEPTQWQEWVGQRLITDSRR